MRRSITPSKFVQMRNGFLVIVLGCGLLLFLASNSGALNPNNIWIPLILLAGGAYYIWQATRFGPKIALSSKALHCGAERIELEQIRAIYLGVDPEGGYLSWHDGHSWHRLPAPYLTQSLNKTEKTFRKRDLNFSRDEQLSVSIVLLSKARALHNTEHGYRF